MTFKVIDNNTGKEPNLNLICHEYWSERLLQCDVDQFAVTEDGHLLLIDDCENMVYCPKDRFTIIKED